MAITGLYYYKLVSPYSDDVTKNCKLSVSEIDSNFYNLKSADIKSAELDEATNSIILTRNNGDTLAVDFTPVLSGSVYDLEVVYDNPSEEDSGSCSGATIYITYSTLDDHDIKRVTKIPIKGLVTTENIYTILGKGLLTRVISDGSLKGNGTIGSPLGIRETEKNTPAIKLIDTTIGEELPTDAIRGDKYLTKELYSDFGRLYNFYAVQEIQAMLDEDGRGWRIPKKSDWDALLNSIEPCGYYKDGDYLPHDDTACHVELGKYAGQKLKSRCGWLGEPECECKNNSPMAGNYCPDGNPGDNTGSDDVIDTCAGTDEYKMTILPTGYKDKYKISPEYVKNATGFWTQSHILDLENQDIYIKKFEWNRCGVVQEAQCVSDFYSIRLVKDFDGENSYESESIDGLNYRTILFPDSKQVWTASNYYADLGSNCVFAGNSSYHFKTVYVVNVWNGNGWDKRVLTEGESIVILEENEHCQSNIEYRVFMESGEDGCNNQILVNTDDAVTERVIDVIKPLIEQEEAERKAADAVLQEEIEAESERAQEVEQQLWEAIDREAQAREDVDQQLWDAISQEASARTDVDNQLWDAIAQEASARTDVDNQQWAAINAESEARIQTDGQLWDAINNEAAARMEVDNQQWEAINNETSARIDVDNQLWKSIADEYSARTQSDMELWDALNQEIEDRIEDVNEEEARAKAEEDRIEKQIIDNPNDPYNDATATVVADIDGVKHYVLKANGGVTLYSKGGTNDIPVILDADFGTF